MLNNQEFFNAIANQYDSMIPFERSVEVKKKLFEKILINKNCSVADIGCGTGSDSIALLEFGCKVVSFDPSAEMIDQAKFNAKNKELRFVGYQYAAAEIPDKFNKKFDLIVSFGNAFANIERGWFLPSIKKCYNLLKNQGSLYIQVLNYKKIIKEKKRIINITESEGHFFIRFYDFINDEIKFNILEFYKADPKENNLITTSVYPYSC